MNIQISIVMFLAMSFSK